MTPAEISQLVVSGGAIGVLTVFLGLILRGELRTKASVAEVRAADAALAGEVKVERDRAVAAITRDRDEWKAIAKDAVREAGELGEALTIRNRIDEDLLRRLGVTVRTNV